MIGIYATFDLINPNHPNNQSYLIPKKSHLILIPEVMILKTLRMKYLKNQICLIKI
ncbi:MAG: hypothetical protein RLZZ628_4116 [Bacteroidota bacterium]|jgi:hypothetical protein